MVEMLRTKTDQPGIPFSASVIVYVTPEFAASIADRLITALQLARPIVANEGDLAAKSQLATWVQATVIEQIDECLTAVKDAFPDAESFWDTEQE
jgi:hypothetical protein